MAVVNNYRRFYEERRKTFHVILFKDKQTDRQTDTGKDISSLAQITATTHLLICGLLLHSGDIRINDISHNWTVFSHFKPRQESVEFCPVSADSRSNSIELTAVLSAHITDATISSQTLIHCHLKVTLLGWVKVDRCKVTNH